MKKNDDDYLLIYNLAKGLELRACRNGLTLSFIGNKAVDLSESRAWHSLPALSPIGLLISQRIQQLIEQEIFILTDGYLFLPYDALPLLDQINFDFLEEMVDWSPLSLKVSSEGFLGSSSFCFSYSFIFGRQQTFGKRVGPFFQRGTTIYRLGPEVFKLLETIDNFNTLSPNQKTKEKTLFVLHSIKSVSSAVEITEYLESEQIIIPSKVKVDVRFDSEGFVSLIPQFDGVHPELMAQEFLRFSEVQSVYDLQLSTGIRTRVIVSDRLKPVLVELQRIRHVGGEERELVLADMLSVLGEGIDRDLIEVTGLGPRVKGVGEPPLRAKIALKRPPTDWGDSESIERMATLLRVEVETDVGITELPISSNMELNDLRYDVINAIDNNKASIVFKGNKILVTDELRQGLDEASKAVFEGAQQPDGRQFQTILRNSRYLLIYSNEEAQDYVEGAVAVEVNKTLLVPTLPKSLRDSFTSPDGQLRTLRLKQHQLMGVSWLQNLFEHREDRRGCLLADDMGLGKTLQILTFLAWCIESGYKNGLGSDEGPYEPILIVAPLILLQNWRDEIEKYFVSDIFYPILVLHDAELRRLQIGGTRAKEVQIGAPKLDLAKIQEYRVVITNYDTVKNYQHSFGRVPWSVVITDEAQEFKEQNARSDALKSLRALFKIVATGTPVENRLLDLWNLVDYMQPGSLLGSSKGFSETYERNIENSSDTERKQLSARLRESLLFGRPDSFVLRRDKEAVLKDLPRKIEKPLISQLSDLQRSYHVQLVNALMAKSDSRHHFSTLHSLKRLYLHPFLLEQSKPVTNLSDWLLASPKLQSVIDRLKYIQKRGEKVLIFALLQDLQVILQQVLGSIFGLRIDIINGAPDSKRVSNLEFRRELIAKFSQCKGFNILILSPRVAGVGLTITSANHVVHYERWWNPAKEAQATDRAYRIGQEKDVFVYYPISVDPLRQFKTFDEKLDELLKSKQQIARDFLVPTSKVEVSQDELINTFVAENANGKSDRPTSTLPLLNSIEAIRRLNGHQFEAFIGLLYQRQGYCVVLGPTTRDGGADLVAVNLNTVVLIQCKHSATEATLRDDAISDLQDASAFYRAKILSENLQKRPQELVAWTNGRFDQHSRSLAEQIGARLFDGHDLLKLVRRFPFNYVELMNFESMRSRSLEELKLALRLA